MDASALRLTAERYPIQVFFTAAALLSLLVTAAFYAGLLPVTRSLRTFVRLASLTFVLVLFAVGFWAGPFFQRVLR